MSLYEWITHCKRVKILAKAGKEKRTEEPIVDVDASFETQNELCEIENTSFHSDVSNVTEILTDPDHINNSKTDKKLGKNMYRFSKDHPLSDSHVLQLLPDKEKTIPNFIGATLPRHDQGDRELYCSTMLAIFQPWCTGNDLK